MTLPVPNLDDRRFQDLVDDAKRLVQQRCPSWTDHNVSDPGVTLIEPFAWMTDQMLYRLNRVPEPQLHQVPRPDRREAVPADRRDARRSRSGFRRRGRTTVTIPTGTEVGHRARNAGADHLLDDRGPADRQQRILQNVASMIGPADVSRPQRRARTSAAASSASTHPPKPGNVLLVGLTKRGPGVRGRTWLPVPHRGRRRRSQNPAAVVGGLDGDGLGRVRTRIGHDRWPE